MLYYIVCVNSDYFDLRQAPLRNPMSDIIKIKYHSERQFGFIDKQNTKQLSHKKIHVLTNYCVHLPNEKNYLMKILTTQL